MRSVFVVALAAALVAGLAGPSGAARLNWEGTLTTTTGVLPPLHLTGGDTATPNQLTPNALQGKRLAVPGTGVKGIGAAAFHEVTRMGFAHGSVSGTTSTAQPSGVLQLVTPSQVRTNLALGSNAKLSILTELLSTSSPSRA
jgi:hypothetical protein